MLILVAQHANGAITRLTVHVFLSAMSDTVFLNDIERRVLLLLHALDHLEQVEVRLGALVNVLAPDEVGALERTLDVLRRLAVSNHVLNAQFADSVSTGDDSGLSLHAVVVRHADLAFGHSVRVKGLAIIKDKDEKPIK